ncbi:MAG: hypothetical protein KJZ69_07340 [Phycisphaerales bacterium]|nr:hypothetical protein [Phycisphaerales bacterium]
MRPILDFCGGLVALAGLAGRGALNRRNRYWQWRRETAFGPFAVTPGQRRRAVLDYGRWVFRMRRFR